jgi:hypothetical protein
MKQILPESNFSFRNMIGMLIRKSLSDMSQARRDNVLLNEFLNIIKFRGLQYIATWQGYRYSGSIDYQLHQRFYYPPGLLSKKIPGSRPVKPIDYEAGTKEEQ